MNPFFVIILLAIIEGITEFLPISSTGHLILAEFFIGEHSIRAEFIKQFIVIIQLGSILAVVFYFWDRVSPFVKSKEEFRQKFQLWMKVLVGVIPAAVIGLFADDYIDRYFMDNIIVVASMLIFYGLLFIVLEYYQKRKRKTEECRSFRRLRYRTALLIGFFQCLAMIPGTSRSGATILGALLLGLSRPLAAEFSFYLAIPTMLGATLLKMMKAGIVYTKLEWIYLGIGTLISFLVAYLVIHWLMEYIRRKDFVFFGVYRILLGIVVFILYIWR